MSDIRGSETALTPAGRIVLECWSDLEKYYPHVETDEFVVMPNHVHGIIALTDWQTKTENSGDLGAGLKPAPTRRHSLSEIVRAFKTFSSRRINQLRNTPGTPVWQQNYYERVIRNERELEATRQYIVDNPAKWAEDSENPENIRRQR